MCALYFVLCFWLYLFFLLFLFLLQHVLYINKQTTTNSNRGFLSVFLNVCFILQYSLYVLHIQLNVIPPALCNTFSKSRTLHTQNRKCYQLSAFNYSKIFQKVKQAAIVGIGFQNHLIRSTYYIEIQITEMLIILHNIIKKN